MNLQPWALGTGIATMSVDENIYFLVEGENLLTQFLN